MADLDSWQEGEETFRLVAEADGLRYERAGHAGWRWTLGPGNEGEVSRRHAELVGLVASERLRREQAQTATQVVQMENEQLIAELQGANGLREGLANELAEVRRELSEHKGIWREAVRALLKETRAAASLSPLLTRDLANALLCAKSEEQRIVLVRDDLRPIAKVAERFGWQVEEPLAEWLEAALTWHEPGEEIKRAAQAHGYDPAGPQRLPDFIGDKLHALERFKEAHATEEQRVRQLQADLAEMRESWTSANARASRQTRNADQLSRALSMLKLRVQELLELAQAALKEE